MGKPLIEVEGPIQVGDLIKNKYTGDIEKCLSISPNGLMIVEDRNKSRSALSTSHYIKMGYK